MVLLKPEEFLDRLSKFFQDSKTSGCVRLTLKQYDGRTKPKSAEEKHLSVPETKELMCLIRAQCRSKKIAAVIHQDQVEKFQSAYRALMRSSMDGLKKTKLPRKPAAQRGKRAKVE